MKNARLHANILGAISFSTLIFIAGCNGSSSSTNQSASTEQGNEQVTWSSVSSSDNPQTADTALDINGITTLKINIFNFNGDVQLMYSPTQPMGTGILRMYTVSSDGSSVGWINHTASSGELDVSANGAYNCNISISGGTIQSLQGACYVKMQIILPSTAQNIRVINDGMQLTN